jgi:hypothetical protein
VEGSDRGLFEIPCHLSPRGGRLEYLHRSPANRRRRRKGNPVPGGITGPLRFWGNINTGTWSSRLGVRRKANDPALLKNNYCSEIERSENLGESGRIKLTIRGPVEN